MIEENIRFREPQIPPGLSAPGWYDGFFEYDGFIYALTTQGYPPYVVRLRRQHTGTNSWEWREVENFHLTHPAISRAIQLWSQEGYSEMSLAEFLNATVPQ